VERAIKERRSTRHVTNEPVTVEELSQLLWAGQGVTQATVKSGSVSRHRRRTGHLRAAPSAGALFPLELCVVVGSAQVIPPGVYRYLPGEHALVQSAQGDFRKPLWDVALQQDPIRRAPITIVIAAVTERTAVKYGERALRYVHMEVGAAAENIALQARSVGLGTVLMGAFRDDAVRRLLGLPSDHHVLAILPVGHPPPG